jgi:simple sugar transport system permease protein
MRAKRGVPEVLSTILLNFAAAQLVSWLVRGPIQESARAYPQSDPIAPAAMLTRLAPPYSFHAGTLLALAAVPLLGLYLFRTASGFRLRSVGLGAEAARYAGFRPARIAAGALVASGAIAGLAGGVQVAGLTGRLYADLSGGMGYLAIAVALLGRLHPAGVAAAALLFGALDAGAAEMQRSAGVSAALAQVVQAAALGAVAVLEVLSRGVSSARSAAA